ncbi:MAG: hypothetical protein Q7R96_06570 [Nanoarchaeota archaeon]|nr:hypothetical protein [Nanoarchaeota archaeon]
MVYAIPLWQELLLYGYFTIVAIAFVLLTKLQIAGLQLITMKWKVVLALLSPILLVLLLALAPLLILGVLIFFNKLRAANKSLKITIKRFDQPKEE